MVIPGASLVLRLLLAVLRLPFLLPILSFFVLFQIASHTWCAVYDCNGIWKPAWPDSWSTWVICLVVASINAAMWLLWLLGREGIILGCDRWRRGQKYRRGHARPQNGSPRRSEDEDEYMLLPETDHDDERRRSNSAVPNSGWRETRMPSLRTVFWWMQVVMYASIVLVGSWEALHYEHPNDIRFRPELRRALADPQRNPAGYAKGEKIFIAAAFYDNEQVLPYWMQTMLSVITYLGTQNVFVSIVESNSHDKTPELLRGFAATLAERGVAQRILVHDDAIEKPDDMSFNNRINFLAAVRNRAMEPLVEDGGYDRVLFSNDVYVEPESVIELLETRNGTYDMVCGMDFNHFGAYDAWVLRDRLGHLTSTIWPYFIDAPSIQQMREDLPVPAFTCWNGIVVFNAEPLLPIALRPNRTLSPLALSSPLPRTHPAARNPDLRGPSPALTPPLRFRSADRGAGECFSSESFMLPYDMRRLFGLDRVYVNPRVVTSYQWKFYVWYKWVLNHRLVRWWVREVYDGWRMERKKMIVGDEASVWVWDGGDCHPWW